MKRKLKTCLLIAAAVGITSGLSAAQIQIFSPEAGTGYVGLSADGTNLTTFAAGSWNFSAAKVGPGFVAGDWSTWGANIDIFNTAPWVVSPPFAAGKFDATWIVPAGSEFTGNQAYIWGYNQIAIDPAVTEWVLVTNPAWVFPVNDPLAVAPAPGNIWNINDASNTWVVGERLANGFQMEAIPEPSTYALIFGLGILGFLGFRRFRK